MNIRSLTLAVALTAAASLMAQDPYRIIVSLGDTMNGAEVRLMNYDTADTIATTKVIDGLAKFEGTIDEPVPAAISADAFRRIPFVLESGTIGFNLDQRYAFGTMLNDRMHTCDMQVELIEQQFENAENEDEQQAAYERYMNLWSNIVDENSDNPIGYFYYLSEASGLSSAQFQDYVVKYPYLKQFKRVSDGLTAALRRDATQPGGKMVDFEVPYQGTMQRLSDYVGRGDYVLVDFWASWCGPCIRQTKVLKEIYEKYADSGLKVLGVAVWDKPEDTLEAIKRHDLPWPSFINCGKVPTDLYGITGIPCIILFGPDGTILSRDKQSEELKADVDKYFGSTLD